MSGDRFKFIDDMLEQIWTCEIDMAKTAAERQKEYRDRQRNTQNAMATAAGVIIPVLDDGIERNAPTEQPLLGICGK